MQYLSAMVYISQTYPTDKINVVCNSLYPTPWIVKKSASSPLITTSCVTGYLTCQEIPSHPHVCVITPSSTLIMR